jgi:hypothetical protein
MPAANRLILGPTCAAADARQAMTTKSAERQQYRPDPVPNVASMLTGDFFL